MQSALYSKLMQEDGGELLGAGQVIGRAIHLVFDLGDQQLVFGVGTAQAKITNDTCGEPWVALLWGRPKVTPATGWHAA